MKLKRTTYLPLSLCICVVVFLSCARGPEQEPKRRAAGYEPTVPGQSLREKLAESIDRIECWPGHSTNYSRANWSTLVAAAKVLQMADQESAEEALRQYQRNHKGVNTHDSKLLLLMRVAFDLPETQLVAERVGFGGWRDWSGSYNMTTNAAWPISWNEGNPRLVVGFDLFQGRRYDAPAEYRYFRSRYQIRNLASFQN